MDFELSPPVAIAVGKILFVDELLGSFIESDAHVLKSIEGGAQIDFFNVKPCKFGIASRQHTVNDELDKLKQSCRSVHLARVHNVAANNCDPCAIGVQFLEEDFTDNLAK